MKGHIRQRGANSFELKFDAERDPVSGKRRIKYHSFKGTKREAQKKLAELVAGVSTGNYVEPSKITVVDFVRSRIDQWQASKAITARTAQRYRQLCEKQIAPHIGGKLLQKLRPIEVEEWHNVLRIKGSARGKPVSAQTIRHAHRLLSKALNDAVRIELTNKNVCKVQQAPKVTERELTIVRDIPGLLKKLDGEWLRIPAIIALFTGLRMGEVFALRWGQVDLDRKALSVREALEETKEHGIRFKAPKSAAGRRTITLPDYAVSVLREHRLAQLELRMQLAAGKLMPADLVFQNAEGGVFSPSYLSKAWSDLASRIGAAGVTFHALRHTHASQLIDAGVDIVTISKRLGHAKPDITLRVYAHLFKNDDSKASDAINNAFSANI